MPGQIYAAEPVTETELKTENTAKTETEPKTESSAKTETEPKTEAAVKVETEPKTEGTEKQETEKATEPSSETLPETEGKPESGTETGTEGKPESGTETGTEGKPESGTETGTEGKPESGTETGTEGKPESGTETGTESKPENETETGAESESGANTESESESASEAASEKETELRLAAELESEGETESQSESERKSHSYLEFLEIYKDALGTRGTCELTREEELDELFGGTVYMTTFGSTTNSAGFFVSAGLSEYAPAGQNTPMELSAYDLSGTLQKVTMKPSTQAVKRRFRITNGEIFHSGINGTKRAVYTLTIGTEEDRQIYKILVNRELELTSLSAYVSDPLESIIKEPFAAEQKQYTASVPAHAEAVQVNVQKQTNADFILEIGGQAAEAGTACSVPLTGLTTEIPITLHKEETYAGAEYEGLTYESTGSYVLTVQRSMTADVEFLVEPEDAVVCVYDSMGGRIYPDKEKEHYFSELLCGNTYTYQVSAYGYQTQRQEWIPQGDQQITVSLDYIDSKQEELTGNEWWNYRNNEENNGVTQVSTPEKKEETSQKWAMKLGGDWNAASTPPLLLGGELYTAAGKYIYRISKETGEVLAVSEELKGSMSFALNPLTYAEGMIFAQIGSGQVQAVSAKTLKSLWISEPVGGQTLSPITYKNGYIYTGTWNSETAAGSYFCLSVTDEDPSRGDETKYCTWKYSHKGGFYWAGSYTNGTYLVFGSDDGNTEGNYSDSSILYSVAARSGILLDKLEGLKGDIRTSIVYENGYVYFATKGGYLYRVAMNADGTFGQLSSYNLGGMATASPVVYKGRIYIGVCGTGGQFNADGGHHFAVLTESAEGLSFAYSIPVGAYPQAGALLSTAYEQIDYNGDGAADGRVYLYFTFNAFPGGIYYFTDEPGQTSGEAELLFVPDTDQQQYCISPICVDQEGVLYYKNDSCYIMAIESNAAYLDGMEVTSSTGNVSWSKEFSRNRSTYELLLDPSASTAEISLTIPEDRSVTINGEAYQGTYTCRLGEDGTETVKIEVKYKNKKRVYTLKLARIQTDATLKKLIVSDSNQISDQEAYLELTPEFAAQQTMYQTVEYAGTKSFLNVYAQAAGQGSVLEMTAVSGVKRINRFTITEAGEKLNRYAVYFDEGASEAVVTLKVTAADKTTVQNYQVTLLRKDVYAPLLSEINAVRISVQEAQIRFSSNEAGTFWYQAVESGADAPKLDPDAPGQKLIQGENRIQIEALQGKGADVYLLAADEKGNVQETPVKVQIQPYQLHTVRLTGFPEGAICVVTDASGHAVYETGGMYQLIDGNTYYIYVICENYEDLTTSFTVREAQDVYEFQMKSLLSQNADLKKLYVSSSSKYGSGILKLSPDYTSDTTRYEAVYTKDRTHLNIWAAAEDKKAEIKVYAVGGVKGTTVNKDETISSKQSADGHDYWEIYFEKGTTTAEVRICVKAEDGTIKNYFVKLSIKDLTAPVLRRVSASRISLEQASVVFQTNEGGTYYYAVTEKGAKAPRISRSNGTDVLEGTVTISLSGLTKGEKEVYVILTDAAGNESEVLILQVPDVRSSGYTGSVIGGAGGGGQLAGGLKPGDTGTSADGSKDQLTVATTVKKTYTTVSRPVINGSGDGYVIRNGVKYKYVTKKTVNKKVSYLTPDGLPEVIPLEEYWNLKYQGALPVLWRTQEADTLPWELRMEETEAAGLEEQLEQQKTELETATREAVQAQQAEAAGKQSGGFSKWKIQWLDLSVRTNQLLLVLAGIGMCYLMFVLSAVTVNRRRRR